MFKDSLGRLTQKQDLTAGELTEFVEAMRDETVTDVQIAGFLVAMLMKGPTVDEVAAIARAMRANCVQIRPDVDGNLTDMCGTGGGLTTFNVSSANAILTAAAGVPVAKHGSRSISASSGSADALEALGVSVELTPDQGRQLIEQVGISFLYAPNFHPIMLKVFFPELALGIKTIFFTIIGPLIMFRATAPVRERIKLTQRIDIPDVESAALVAHLQMVARRMLAPARIEDHI